MLVRARDSALGVSAIAGVVLAVAVAGALLVDPILRLRPAPSSKALAIEQTVLRPNLIELHVRNTSGHRYTVSQVAVNAAFWAHSVDHRTMGKLDRATLRIPYPWEPGQSLAIGVFDPSGAEFPTVISSPTEVRTSNRSPALVLGRVVGIVLGLGALVLVWPRLTARFLADLLAGAAVGVVVYLLFDVARSGLHAARSAPPYVRGEELFVAAAVLAAVAAAWIVARQSSPAGHVALAGVVALGAGLYNMGETFRVTNTLLAGEAVVGASLIMGGALVTASQTLPIVAPIAVLPRPSLHDVLALGAVVAVPVIAGALLATAAAPPARGLLLSGLATGALAVGLWRLARSLVRVDQISGAMAIALVAGAAAAYVVGALAR